MAVALQQVAARYASSAALAGSLVPHTGYELYHDQVTNSWFLRDPANMQELPFLLLSGVGVAMVVSVVVVAAAD